MNTAAQPSPGNAPAQTPPLFYSQIQPLVPQMHKDFKVAPDTYCGFAAKTNTVPVTMPEFSLAARHYPIMLLGDELVPTLALGFQPDQNLFVNTEGEWERGWYVPAYVRRYPFILLGAANEERLTLGVDNAANSTKPGARPLFGADGKETETVTQALNFCGQFHDAFLVTQEFSKAIKAANIVDERSLEVELTPGKKTVIGTFKRIDEEKFRDLPDATVLDWRKKGFLHACHFQLQSMNNWDMLLAKNGNLTGNAPAAA